MRRIGTVVIRIFVISLALVLLVFAQKQPATSRTQPTSPSSRATEQTPKIKGRNLVKKLPAGIEGVTLEDGFIKLKPGYKFVKGANGTVTVNLAGRSGGVGGASIRGTFNCECDKTGSCSVATKDGNLVCTKSPKDGCSGTCELLTIISGESQSLVAF